MFWFYSLELWLSSMRSYSLPRDLSFQAVEGVLITQNSFISMLSISFSSLFQYFEIKVERLSSPTNYLEDSISVNKLSCPMGSMELGPDLLMSISGVSCHSEQIWGALGWVLWSSNSVWPAFRITISNNGKYTHWLLLVRFPTHESDSLIVAK